MNDSLRRHRLQYSLRLLLLLMLLVAVYYAGFWNGYHKRITVPPDYQQRAERDAEEVIRAAQERSRKESDKHSNPTH
jgi:hypothetical protein